MFTSKFLGFEETVSWSTRSCKIVFVLVQIHGISIVKSVFRDHYHERLPWPVMVREQRFWTCDEKPPVSRDHIFLVQGAVSRDGFTRIIIWNTCERQKEWEEFYTVFFQSSILFYRWWFLLVPWLHSTELTSRSGCEQFFRQHQPVSLQQVHWHHYVLELVVSIFWTEVQTYRKVFGFEE